MTDHDDNHPRTVLRKALRHAFEEYGVFDWGTPFLSYALNSLDEQGYEIQKKGAPNLTAITGGVNQVTNGENNAA